MAEGITLKRIIDMDEAAELSSSDYAIVDSATGGPKKFALGNELSQLKEDLSDLQAEIESGGSGLTTDLKAALDQLAQKVAYIDESGQDYYDALHAALYPPANLTRISCVYTQSGTVYDTDTLDSLKSDLVVTAHFSDNTTQTVTTYTLSGTLTEGISTVTVSYGGKTTTFDVTVTVIPMHDGEEIITYDSFGGGSVENVPQYDGAVKKYSGTVDYLGGNYSHTCWILLSPGTYTITKSSTLQLYGASYNLDFSFKANLSDSYTTSEDVYVRINSDKRNESTMKNSSIVKE